MKIKKLHIKNFKSIADLEIIEPSPFTVFVGPNGAGKSNIFEALEFLSFQSNIGFYQSFLNLFGGVSSIHNRNSSGNIVFEIKIDDEEFNLGVAYAVAKILPENQNAFNDPRIPVPYGNILNRENIEYFEKKYANIFSRIFIRNKVIEKIPIKGDSRLSTSCDNLEKVIKHLLQDESKREEIVEWLSLFIPGFENLEILSSELSGTDTLLMYEKGTKKPFTKDLLSDGTFNILALLAAVYQSDEPQFLCIEEPENGLNPFVIRKLVDFFRQACEDKGHYIWLNTHSQTLVECLTPEEIIVVDKVGGETKIKQIKGMNLHGLDMAEVWLSGALGGGTPW